MIIKLLQTKSKNFTIQMPAIRGLFFVYSSRESSDYSLMNWNHFIHYIKRTINETAFFNQPNEYQYQLALVDNDRYLEIHAFDWSVKLKNHTNGDSENSIYRFLVLLCYSENRKCQMLLFKVKFCCCLCFLWFFLISLVKPNDSFSEYNKIWNGCSTMSFEAQQLRWTMNWRFLYKF